jgi:hypothetical protein
MKTQVLPVTTGLSFWIPEQIKRKGLHKDGNSILKLKATPQQAVEDTFTICDTGFQYNETLRNKVYK